MDQNTFFSTIINFFISLDFKYIVSAIISTFLGNIFGYKLALNQFEKQDQTRVKNDLKLKIYYDYNDKFNILTKELNNLSNNIDNLSSLIWFLEKNYHENEVDCTKTIQIQNTISSLENLLLYFKDLENYIRNTKFISNSHTSLYNELTYSDEFNLIIKIKNDFIKLKNASKSPYSYTLKTLKKIYTLSGNENSEKISYDIKFNKLLENINQKHLKITNEFISEYLK